MRPIGSSSIGAIFGVSPYKTAADVAEGLRRDPSGGYTGRAQDLGHLIEPGLRAELSRALDVEVLPGPPYEEPPWPVAENQVSHPDGYRPTIPGWVRLAEFKALSSWDGWDEDVPRPDYALQVRHQMEAKPPEGWQVEGVDLYAYNYETGERRLYRIERDARGARLVGRIGDWYHRHIIEAVPVPLTVPAVYVPRDIPAPVYAPVTEEAQAAIAVLRDARLSVKVAKEAEESAHAALAALLGTADGFTIPDGAPVLTYHQQDARRVNPEAVRDLMRERPDLAPLLARCFTTSTSRVMRLPKERA